MPPDEAVLIDTGPLVAIVDADESRHRDCLEALNNVPRRTRLLTTSPVLTEAFYLLSSVSNGRDRLFDLISALKLDVAPLTTEHFERVQKLMTQYHDLPMDFADAVLVATAEEMRIRTVFTLDRRGFQVYKPAHTRRLSIVP